MGRSLKKGPYIDEKLFAKVNKLGKQLGVICGSG